MAALSPTAIAPPTVATSGRRLHLVYPFPCHDYGIASIPLELCDAIATDPELRHQFLTAHWVPNAESTCRRTNQRGHSLPWLAWLAHRFQNGERWLGQRMVRRLIAACRPGDLVLVYPGLTPEQSDALRDTGARLIHDPVNTAFPAHWRAIHRAYAAAGMTWHDPAHERATIEEEQRRIHSKDLAFVCSPLVQSSFEAFGLRREDMIPTSNGWNPQRFRPVPAPADETRFLFVGRGCVRKGLPGLLAAWADAKVAGKLVVVGSIDAEITSHCAALLRQPNLELHPFVTDLTPLYSRASAFVLPSFEEGSPLVSYLAMAAGLPSLLSPPAAGWVVRDGIEGKLVEPDQHTQMVAALRQLAEDHELRRTMGAAARERADEFTWQRVAVRRFQALHRLLSAGESR